MAFKTKQEMLDALNGIYAGSNTPPPSQLVDEGQTFAPASDETLYGQSDPGVPSIPGGFATLRGITSNKREQAQQDYQNAPPQEYQAPGSQGVGFGWKDIQNLGGWLPSSPGDATAANLKKYGSVDAAHAAQIFNQSHIDAAHKILGKPAEPSKAPAATKQVAEASDGKEDTVEDDSDIVDSKPATDEERAAHVEDFKNRKNAALAGQSDATQTDSREPAEDDKNQKMLDLLNSQQGFTNNSVQGLKDAQEQRNQIIKNNQLGKIGATLGSVLSRTTPDTAIFDENIKRANQGVEDYQAQTEKEKSDPGSKTSATYRSVIAQFMPELADSKAFQQASATDIEKMFPFVTKHIEGEEARESKEFIAGENNKTREANAKLNNDNKNERAATAADAKKEHQFDVQENLLTTKLNTIGGRGSSPKDQLASKKLSLVEDTFDPMLKQYGTNWNNLSDAQYADLVAVFANLSTGNSATDIKFKKLFPPNFEMTAAHLKQYLTSGPVAAHQGEFIKQLVQSAHDQGDAARAQLNKSYGNWLNQFKGKVRPEFHQLSTDQNPYAPNIPDAGNAHPQDDAAITWAKNNPGDPRSAKILNANGIK